MMSTWTASDPLRHPWFSSASLKRKHSDSEEDDVADTFPHSTAPELDSECDAVPAVYPTPPPERVGNYGGGMMGAAGGPERYEWHGHGERKRRRCDTIERRMARMHIAPGLGPSPAGSASGPQLQTEPQTMDADLDFYPMAAPGRVVFPSAISQVSSTASDASYSTARSHVYSSGSLSPVLQHAVLNAYAVEEPVSPAFERNVDLAPPPSRTPTVTEVRMKGAEPAWYEREKDRIVITDLDEAIAEAEEEEEEYKSEAEPHPNASDFADSNADYSISSVLFDHIKRQANFPYNPTHELDEKKGALVLFRPLPTSLFPPTGAAEAKEKEETVQEGDGVQVDEIDVDDANIVAPLGFEVGVPSMEPEDEGEPMDMDVEL